MADLLRAPMPWPSTLAYVATAIFIALAQGLAQGYISAMLPQIAGQIGATTTETSWLIVAFMVPKTVVPLLLIKIRTQYGLRKFTEIGILCFVVVNVFALFAMDLRSAFAAQFMAGLASAPLSTIAFLYMLEGFSPALKIKVGLPLALTFLMMGTPLARVVAPPLMGDGSWHMLNLMGVGMALVSFALVVRLPLAPITREKVIAPMDFLSFVLMALGMGGLIAAFVQGPILWWTEVGWVGWVLVGSLLAMAAAVVIELHRKEPLLDIAWISSGPILHLAAVMLMIRLLVSEQAAGAPRMFQAMGLGPEQLMPLFWVVVAASLAGGIACAILIKAERAPYMYLASLLLIALGAYLDSQSTMDTRPAQMFLSQSLIAFAAALMLPPLMLTGLMQALVRGPTYILSFVIVFTMTQALGGILGAGMFTTIINERQAVHIAELTNNIPATAQLVNAEIATRAGALTGTVADPQFRQGQAVSSIGEEVAAQSMVMAYNDAYMMTAIAALFAASLLVLHMLRDWMAAPAPVAGPAGGGVAAAPPTKADGASPDPGRDPDAGPDPTPVPGPDAGEKSGPAASGPDKPNSAGTSPRPSPPSTLTAQA